MDGYPVLPRRDFGSINDHTEHGPTEYGDGVAEHGDEDPFFEEPVDFRAVVYFTLLLEGSMDAEALLVLDDGIEETSHGIPEQLQADIEREKAG